MAINLISRFGRERARGSLDSSFAQFQADRAVVGLDRQVRRNQTAIDELIDSAQCHLGDFNQYASMRREVKELEALLSKRGGRKTFDNRQRQHLEGEIDQIRKALRNHACHGCNEREAHARLQERAGRLQRENEGLTNRIENRTHVIAKTFDRICAVLDELGYIEGEKPLAQGKILAKIYAESDLLLTETIRLGLLDELNPAELLSVVSCMIYQSRSQEDLAPKIPHQNVASALGEIAHVWGQLEEIEEKHQVQTQKAPDLGFCYISYRWANGNSLNNVLKGSDMSVGDFVRSTKQLIDLMNQIAAASEKLRPTCREAVKRIDRGVVSYMLGDL
jgi:ATP-dependent RNA helicase HelY